MWLWYAVSARTYICTGKQVPVLLRMKHKFWRLQSWIGSQLHWDTYHKFWIYRLDTSYLIVVSNWSTWSAHRRLCAQRGGGCRGQFVPGRVWNTIWNIAPSHKAVEGAESDEASDLGRWARCPKLEEEQVQWSPILDFIINNLCQNNSENCLISSLWLMFFMINDTFPSPALWKRMFVTPCKTWMGVGFKFPQPLELTKRCCPILYVGKLQYRKKN